MAKHRGDVLTVRPEDLVFPDLLTHESGDGSSDEGTIENQLEEAKKLLSKTMSRQCEAEKIIEDCKLGQRELEKFIALLDKQLKQQRQTQGLSEDLVEADNTPNVLRDNRESSSRNSHFSMKASSLRDTAKNIWESRRPAWNGLIQSFRRYGSDASRQLGKDVPAPSFRPPLVGAL